jgi:excisionase family DNA binding protein
MAGIYLREAAKLAGVNPSTLHRAMKNGKLSFTLDGDGQRLIDPAELDRWKSDYQPQNGGNRSKPDASDSSQSVEFIRLQAQLDIEKAKAAGLLEKLADIKGQLDDMRDQRDQWQTQAQTLLLGNQSATQPVADEPLAATSPQEAPPKQRWRLFGRRSA